jgi:tetratricopeptide (TPR) repeat protein
MLRFRALSCLAVVVIVCAIVGCQQPASTHQEASATIPVSSGSEEARAAFLKGREMQENLRATDARRFFQEAVSHDPEFAWAHLGLAFTSTTASEFFSALATATQYADRASDGERLLIRAFEAGTNNQPEVQRGLLEELVAAYPSDERAQNQMGLYYFGRQDWVPAAKYLERAISINPGFAPAYNQLGYARRFMGDYAGAEEAFVKYVELIPDEPNPYDSYAELLMKMGRFDESIAQYELALDRNPNFVASYVGIGNNHMFGGNTDAAMAAFDRLEAVARTDGERRQACTWRAFAHLHNGDHESAIAEIRRRYDIAAETDDFGAMSGDLNVIGDILLDSGQAEAARSSYEEQLVLSEKSNATAEAKQGVRRNHLADLTRVALQLGDLDAATASLEEYRRQVEQRRVAFEIWQVHELEGLIAIARGDYAKALEELAQANQQDARVMLAQARALWKQGEQEAAREMCERSANFYTLNQVPMNYAFARPKALEMLEEQGA